MSPIRWPLSLFVVACPSLAVPNPGRYGIRTPASAGGRGGDRRETEATADACAGDRDLGIRRRPPGRAPPGVGRRGGRAVDLRAMARGPGSPGFGRPDRAVRPGRDPPGRA